MSSKAGGVASSSCNDSRQYASKSEGRGLIPRYLRSSGSGLSIKGMTVETRRTGLGSGKKGIEPVKIRNTSNRRISHRGTEENRGRINRSNTRQMKKDGRSPLEFVVRPLCPLCLCGQSFCRFEVVVLILDSRILSQ